MDQQQGLNETYWNQRYRENLTAWDLGAISTPLKAYIDQLSDLHLRILIPGAGNAYEAEYLFYKNFRNVFVCDIATEALGNFKTRCPGFTAEHLLHLDFFDLKGSFDLILEQTFFCALHPSLRPAYFEKMAELLVPGGHLAGVLFNDPLNADKPPFGGNLQEYLGYIHAPFRIKTLEECYNSIQPRQERELFINLEKV